MRCAFSAAGFACALLLATAQAEAQTRPQAAANAAKQNKCVDAAEAGERLQAAGKLTEARASFVTCGNSECPRVIQTECLKFLAKVDEAMPSILVRVRTDANQDVTAGTVTIDGAQRGNLSDAKPLSVDPGMHRIAISSGTFQKQVEVVVAAGEKSRVVPFVINLPGAKAAAPAEPRPPLWPGLVVGGAGIVVGATGARFWGTGLNDRDTLQTGCGRTGQCSTGDVRAARTQLIVGDIMMGAGVITLAVGVYLVLRHALHPAAARPSTANASLGPNVLQLSF